MSQQNELWDCINNTCVTVPPGGVLTNLIHPDMMDDSRDWYVSLQFEGSNIRCDSHYVTLYSRGCGGCTECILISTMAESGMTKCTFHCVCTPLCEQVNIQIQNPKWASFVGVWNLCEVLFENPSKFADVVY